MVTIRWSNEVGRFQIIEKYSSEAIVKERVLWDYANEDGSPAPLIGDRVINWLNQADTRKWPMHERLKALRQGRDAEAKAREDAAYNELETRMLEDYNHIAGIPTFFFGKNMPMARAAGKF
jgi:hypothetical protein